MDTTRQDFGEFPGLDLAYDHVDRSYSVPGSRLDVIKGRMGSVISLAASVTLAVPGLMRGLDASVDFLDWRFLGALVLGVLAVCWGLWERNRGTLKTLDLPTLRDKYLKLAPPEFKWRVIYWAAEHFDENMREVARRACALDILTGLVVLEALVLTWWISFP